MSNPNIRVPAHKVMYWWNREYDKNAPKLHYCNNIEHIKKYCHKRIREEKPGPTRTKKIIKIIVMSEKWATTNKRIVTIIKVPKRKPKTC